MTRADRRELALLRALDPAVQSAGTLARMREAGILTTSPREERSSDDRDR